MSANSSFTNASTPPQRTKRGSASFASASRVDALYDRQPQVSFIDSAASEDDEVAYSAFAPATRREDVSNGASPTSCCWSCRQTQRLRASLKKIELDYLSQIQSLQEQLKHATTQRALALQERDELLSNSDAAATQQSMIEQEAQALRVEVMQAVQERHELRGRVQELEMWGRRAAQQQWQWGVTVLEELEQCARRAWSDSENDARRLFMALCMADEKTAAATEARRVHAAADTTPRRCNAASGALANGSTILSSTFSPNSTSSPGPSDGGRERRICSPRPSQRRGLSPSSGHLRLHQQQQQPHTQRPSVAGDSPRSGSEGAVAVSRTLVLSHSAEDAEERVKKMEWQLEQQRSNFEMQLADERALTADMQAEVDDLIENELVLLESEDRLTIARTAAEAYTALFAQHTRRLAEELRQTEKRARVATAPTASTHADVLDLVQESELATWRTDMSEMMSTVQQQLYQLVSATRSSRAKQEAWGEVKECVQEAAAEVREELAALLDTSAQARVDSDALLEEIRRHFADVEERQSRQEAFMVAMASRAARSNDDAASSPSSQALQEVRSELSQQRQLSEKLCQMLQRESAQAPPDKLRAAVIPSSSQERENTCNGKQSLSPTFAGCDDPLSNITTVSDSTVDRDSAPPQRGVYAAETRFVMPEEALFDPQRIHVDANAAAEQISALLSDETESDADRDFPSPYEEY
ncbi:hypothetical protein N2W54_007225 [Lotmaria passim]